MNSRLHCTSPGKVGKARTYKSVWCCFPQSPQSMIAPKLVCISLRLPSNYVTGHSDKHGSEHKHRAVLLQLHSSTWSKSMPNSANNLYFTQDRAKQKGNSIRNPEIGGTAG